MERSFKKQKLEKRESNPTVYFVSHGTVSKLNSAVHNVTHPERYLTQDEKIEILDGFLHNLVFLLAEGDVRGYNIPELGIVMRDVTLGDHGDRAEIFRYYRVDKGKVIGKLRKLLEEDDDLALAINYLKKYYVGRSDRNKNVLRVITRPRTRLAAAVQYVFHRIAITVAEELGLTRWKHVTTYHNNRLEVARSKLREES